MIAAKDTCARILQAPPFDPQNVFVGAAEGLEALFDTTASREFDSLLADLKSNGTKINFTHFARSYCEVQLGKEPALDRSDIMPAWLRQEAVMSSFNAPAIDSWIPFYTGKLDCQRVSAPSWLHHLHARTFAQHLFVLVCSIHTSHIRIHCYMDQSLEPGCFSFALVQVTAHQSHQMLASDPTRVSDRVRSDLF